MSTNNKPKNIPAIIAPFISELFKADESELEQEKASAEERVYPGENIRKTLGIADADSTTGDAFAVARAELFPPMEKASEAAEDLAALASGYVVKKEKRTTAQRIDLVYKAFASRFCDNEEVKARITEIFEKDIPAEVNELLKGK